ncbi:MAG: hypothetical protein WAM39_18085 [Bryobacteraceae bacterium]
MTWCALSGSYTTTIFSADDNFPFAATLEFFMQVGVHSACFLPLTTVHRRLGALVFASEHCRHFSSDDCDGDVYRSFTRDELLANITLYWMTQSISSSFRLCHEGRKAPLRFTSDDFVHVPCALAHFSERDRIPAERMG